MISHPFAGRTDDCSSSCRDRFASNVLYHNSGHPCVATVCYRLSSVAAERQGGVSEINPDKHGRAFLVSVPLCLCVINLQTKGRNALPCAIPDCRDRTPAPQLRRKTIQIYQDCRAEIKRISPCRRQPEGAATRGAIFRVCNLKLLPMPHVAAYRGTLENHGFR